MISNLPMNYKLIIDELCSDFTVKFYNSVFISIYLTINDYILERIYL